MAQTREKNHGEGNPEADRTYREGAEKFARSGVVDQKAREAANSVGRPDKDRERSPKKKK